MKHKIFALLLCFGLGVRVGSAEPMPLFDTHLHYNWEPTPRVAASTESFVACISITSANRWKVRLESFLVIYSTQIEARKTSLSSLLIVPRSN